MDSRRVTALAAPAAFALAPILAAGILFVPRRVENLGGPATPLAYLGATVAACALAACYAVVASGPLGDASNPAYALLARLSSSRFLAFLFVWPAIFSYLAFAALLASGLAAASGVGRPDAAAVALIAFVVALHALGRLGRTLHVVFTTLFAAAVAVLVVVAVPAIALDNFSPLFPTTSLTARPVASLTAAALVAAFGFAGFEAATLASPVTRRVTVPYGLLAGVVAGGLLATAASFVTLGVIPWTRLVFARAPFADAAASALGVDVARLLAPGVVLGSAVALSAFVRAGGGALAGLGELFPPLARHNRAAAPDLALVTFGAVAAVVVVFDLLTVALYAAVLGVALQYLAVAVGVALLPRLRPALYARCHVRPPPAVLAVVGLLAAVVAASFVSRTLAFDPVVVISYTRVSPLLSPAATDSLLRAPARSVLPALVGWETVGVLAYVAAGDYRASRGRTLDSLDSNAED